VQINHSRGNGIFFESAQESRFNVETRTPTAWGESRSFVEFDFKGCNNFSCNNVAEVSNPLVPRLRYAYGALGGFLAGQADSNFRDADAEPESLDFGGPPGQAGVVRTPQVRYTYLGPLHSAWTVALEAPDTDVLTPAGRTTTQTNLAQFPVSNKTPNSVACEANGVSIPGTTSCALTSNPAMSKAPDFTFASYWAQPWGHVDFRFVLRDLTWNDGAYVDRSLLGYGGGISGNVLPGWFGWTKDNIVWQFNVGNGIGRYLTDGTNAGLATNYVVAPGCATPTPGCALAATNIIMKTIPAVGLVVSYQHFWSPTMRSNIAYGIDRYQVPFQLIGPIESTAANKQLQSALVNFIWSPVAFIDVRVEYFWGQRQVVANIYGAEQLLIGKLRVKY
jgi:DcaP outer membrane protein